ncbi:BA14K family protein [Acuticoccus kandeliae]|uniref:BA14K family protein n=1 Tax=Acuticoccus kandeliae TaxID=2073160 RepID=UPI001FE8E5F5|nr:BA14K family protein [Acuticoccus kandeliae]
MTLGRFLAIAAVTASAWVSMASPGVVSPAAAADLYTVRPYVDSRGTPRYFGRYEPWSRSEERPPRRGEWFLTSPIPPRVNFLVPMDKAYLYARPEPWTPAWYTYCSERWPSFNPRTGTIRTPDGVRMCF